MNWLHWRKKRRARALAAALSLFVLGAVAKGSVPVRQVREIPVAANASDEAVLGRPIALALHADRLYIADALDCAVKVFSTDGRYLRSIGRKGQAPGELSFPSGVCLDGTTIAVADKMNFRIQFFDLEGKPAGGFKLPFAPDRVLALGGGRLLITSNPTSRQDGERLLHLYDPDGRPVWDGLEPFRSTDPVADAFRNMILVCAGTADDFYVVYRSGDRTIRRYSGTGALAGAIDVDPEYRSKGVVTPDAGRGRLKLAGFCWAAAFDRGLLYLSAPDIIDGKDLGPGRSVCVVDARGRLQAVIELPCAVHRFIVAGGRLYAVDDLGDLRIFEVGP